jgi:hypothetical protein
MTSDDRNATRDNLLRRIDDRIAELQAKEKEERAATNRRNAQHSTGPVAGTDYSDLSSATPDSNAPNARASGRAVRPPARITRSQQNRINAQHSTGPRTPEGKQRSSQNSLKHGFFAKLERLDPRDSSLYEDNVYRLRWGLNPDGPVEEKLIEEIAMLSARIQRIEIIEHALLAGNLENDPSDGREIAAAYLRVADEIDRLHRIEVNLRRVCNRTWDRLERMQKERLKMPLDQALKRSEIWLSYESKRTNNPGMAPAHDSRIDDKGNLIRMNEPYERPKPKSDGDKPSGPPCSPPIPSQEDPKTA